MGRHALIDADLLIYEACYRSQGEIDWGEGQVDRWAVLEEAQADFKASIESILEYTDCDEATLALTDSDRAANFRRTVWPSYKCHRETKSDNRPLLYSGLRQWVRETFNVKQKHGIEGDDTIGILATGDIRGLPDPIDRVICSVDKDLDTVPGYHYNWRKSENGISYIPHVVAFYNFMYQTLVGDTSDGYPGLPKVGPVNARRILGAAEDDAERVFWHRVVDAYESKGFREEDALIQARCARILHASDWDWENERPILWAPPGRD